MAESLNKTMTWVEITNKILTETAQENNHQFKEWLLSKEYLGYTISCSREWLYQYRVYRKLIDKDEDHVEVISGNEGSGKSTLGLKKSCINDPTFCNERMFNDSLELFLWLRANVGKTRAKAILLDEGNLLIFNRESQSSGNISVSKLFTLFRQANLYTIICLPEYITIDKGIRRQRIKALCAINRKGSFVHYGKEGIEKINERLQKGIPFKSITLAGDLFHLGGYNRDFPYQNDLTPETYLAFKNKTYIKFLDDTIEALQQDTDKATFITAKSAADKLSITSDLCRKLLNEGKIPGKVIGKRWFVSKDYTITPENLTRNAPPLIPLVHEATAQPKPDETIEKNDNIDSYIR